MVFPILPSLTKWYLKVFYDTFLKNYNLLTFSAPLYTLTMHIPQKNVKQYIKVKDIERAVRFGLF